MADLIIFGTTIKLPGTGTSDEDYDVTVTADIMPGDPGGRHYPASGPIPEIASVIVDSAGGRYPCGDDVSLLLGEDDIMTLEDLAIEAWLEREQELAESGPDDDHDDNPYNGLEEE